MTNEKVPAGTHVKYWGQAKHGTLYGSLMTVKWANECGCKHQTYALEYESEDGTYKLLEKVLETNFTVVETNDG